MRSGLTRTPLGGRARPSSRGQEEADDEADRAADGDVLDAGQPDLPTGRLDDVEEDDDDDGEVGLAGREPDRGRRDAVQEDGDRQDGPEQVVVAAQPDHDRGADDEADDGAGERPQRGRHPR